MAGEVSLAVRPVLPAEHHWIPVRWTEQWCCTRCADRIPFGSTPVFNTCPEAIVEEVPWP